MRLLFCLLLALAAPVAARDSAMRIQAQARPYDGDTFGIDIRLNGIDAFERRQQCADAAGRCFPCGEGARSFMRTAITAGQRGKGAKPLKISFVGESTYGRPVARAEVGGRDLGLGMIEAGWAVARPNYLAKEPKLRAAYVAAELRARAAKRGGFRGRWIDPAEWRRGKRLACEIKRRSASR